MMQLMVRNRVKDYDTWLEYFIRELPRGAAAGLTLTAMWRDVEDPNNVFFQLAVEDVELARAHMNAPESARIGEVSGVLDGEVWFVEAVAQTGFSGS